MPRTGGVYTPPAGTKATPNTTILSAPYNAFVDDLTADANAARPITAGGTGATSASAARTALGLNIGSDVQAYDAGLQSIASLTTAADRMIYTTAADVYNTTSLTTAARNLLADASVPRLSTVNTWGAANVFENSVRVLRPVDHWSSESYFGIGSPAFLGGFSTEGSFGLALTSNGYRNNAGTWTSLGANGSTGAAQIEG